MREVLLSFFIAVMVTPSARAKSEDARKVFEEGTALFEKGEYTRAAAAFREAYQLSSNWKVFYNIAQCESAARHHNQAIAAFKKYLEEGGDSVDPARRNEVNEELTRLQSRESYREGTVLFESGEYEAAATAFRKAYEMNPHWKVLYNIAQSEAAAQDYARALEAFEKYLAMGGDEIILERREEVEAELDRLQRLVGFVEVSAPAGAKIFVDDQERGIAPLPGKLIVVAGMIHELRIVNRDGELLVRKVQVSGRQSISIVVQGADQSAPVQEKMAQQTTSVGNDTRQPATPKRDYIKRKTDNIPSHDIVKRRQRLIPVGIALVATGGATIATGLFVGAVALKRSNDLSEPCGDSGCLPAYHDKNDSIDKLARTSNVLLVTGIGMAAAGTVLFIVGKRNHRADKPVAVIPDVTPTMTGLAVAGRF